MPGLQFVTLDVFTTRRFAGNPLAIVRIPADHELSTKQLQTIAREFNLSETVFMYEHSVASATASQSPEWRIRIFITSAEIPFAGHPTIGTACYALSVMGNGARTGRLRCNAGVITVEMIEGVAKASIPHNVHIHDESPVTIDDIYKIQPLLKSSGVRPQKINTVSPVKGMTFACVELPDLSALEKVGTFAGASEIKLDKEWNEGFSAFYFYVLVDSDRTVHDQQTIQIRTRMIEGLLEDPATGSAACALCSLLALGFKRRTNRFAITQAVEMGRQSDIGVDVTLKDGLDAIEEVILSGSSVKVMEGIIEY